MARTSLLLAAMLLLGLGWVLGFAGEGTAAPNPITADTEPVAAAAASPAVSVPKATPVAASREVPPPDATWWQQSLSETPQQPLIPGDGDHGATLCGRLTVRQQPWLHPANLEIRITRCWLDTVLPIETDTGQRTPARDEPIAHTDNEGRFRFRFLPGSGELFFLIGHGTDWMDFQKIPHLPRRGDELDLGDVFLDQRGGVTGTVTNAFGKPLANVTVRAVDDPLLDATSGFEELRAERSKGLELFQVRGSTRGGPIPDWVVRRDSFLAFPTATTDASGRFQLRGLRPGTHSLFCSFGPAGMLLQHGSSEGVLVGCGRDTDIGDIALHMSSPIDLTFVDLEGKPWVGAEIAFVQQELGFGTVNQRTDAFGRVRSLVPRPSATHVLFAYPGGGPWLDLDWQDGRESMIRVPRPRELRVELVDLHGQRLPGGKLRAYVVAEQFRPVDRPLPSAMQPVEREPGVHVGAFACPIVLVGSAPGFAPGMMRVDEATPQVMTLLPLQTMTVCTRDLAGEPVADATIRIQVHDNPELKFPGAQWAALANDRVLVGRTDEHGELRVPCWPTFFSLQATHADFAPSAGAKLVPSTDEKRVIVMRRRSQVFGTVTIEGHLAPKGMRVRAQQKPPAAHELAHSGFLDAELAVTGDDGSFAFRDLSAGIWVLTPELPAVPGQGSAAGERFRGHELLLSDEQEMHCVIEAQRDPMAAANLTGTVLQNGVPLHAVLVRLREVDSPRLRHRNNLRRMAKRYEERSLMEMLGPEETEPWLQRYETDYTGTFAFADLRPGAEYEVRFDVPLDGRLQFLARRTIRAGDIERPTLLDLSLSTANVRLTCLHYGSVFANRMLRLRQVLDGGDDGARFEVLLDEHGEVVIDELPSGHWTVEPMHGGSCQPAELQVAGGQVIASVLQIND